MEFTLPFPISENKYRRAWPVLLGFGKKGSLKCPCGRAWTARQIISREGKQYKQDVVDAIRRMDNPPRFTVPVKVRYIFHRHDRRGYDIGNFIKALDDGLEEAKVFTDDRLIDDEHLIRGEVRPKKGCVRVFIEAL